MKTFGTISFSKGRWHIDCEPHVLMRLKRVFPKVSKRSRGTISLLDNLEVARDLHWFCQRYPLVATGDAESRLNGQAAQHHEQEGILADLLAGLRPPTDYDLAIPARSYQRVAADMVMTRGGLLLADDLGIGKTCSGICVLSRAEARPALVVTMTHLTRQWASEINRFAPRLNVHVLKKATPYDLRATKRSHPSQLLLTPETPDVIVTNYHKLSGWADTLAPLVKSVVYDEVQELRRVDSQKYTAAEHISKAARFRLGLSVGPDSHIELTGGPFGDCWTGTISDAWGVVASLSVSTRLQSYDLVPVLGWGVRARSWTGTGFGWQPVKTFVRHSCTEGVRQLTAGGSRLVVTDDHSVFRATTTGIEHVPSDALSRGDILVGDNGRDWETAPERPLDILPIAAQVPRAQIVVDLSGTTRQRLGVRAWQWQNFHREASYGTRLPVKIYQEHAGSLPEPRGIYIGRGKAPLLPIRVTLSSWAYVLGFFLGDGWVTKNLVSFAVETARVEAFCAELKQLGIGLRPKVHRMPGASSEVRCSHRLFASVIQGIFGRQKCFNKRIPAEWLFTWTQENRRLLLSGLVDSDGYTTKSSKGEQRYTTTSAELAGDVQLLLRSLGVSAGCYSAEPKPGGVVRGRRICWKRTRYDVVWSRFALEGDNTGYRGKRTRFHNSHGRFNEIPLRSSSAVSTPNFVYDLEIDGYPSFVAEGLLCHNTATPIYNYGDEIFAIVQCLLPGALGSRTEFLEEWCRYQNARAYSIADPKAFGTYARDAGIMLRRTRADVGRELPDLTRSIQTVDSDAAELAKVEGPAAELARIILEKGESARGEKFRASEELSGIVRQATGIAKAPYVAAFVRMLIESGEPVVLFGWHRAVYDLWLEQLKDLKPALYTGSESESQKAAARERFLSGDTKLLIMSLRSGAGLDGLQAVCRTVAFGELDWSPGVHEQCIGRIHRDGQGSPVLAYFLVATDGCDPIMVDVLGLKRAQSDGVRDPSGTALENLDTGGQHGKRLAEEYLRRKVAA